MCKAVFGIILLFLIRFISNLYYENYRGIVMTKITQKLLTEKMIPIAAINSEKFEKLRISIDGHNAECFIFQRINSDKIIILFEKEHPEFGKEFSTKYFQFKEPGKMIWGHSGKYMHIKIA